MAISLTPQELARLTNQPGGPTIDQRVSGWVTGGPTISSPGSNVLASKFEQLWDLTEGPTLVKEFKFHPTRKWRADYCHLPTKTIIELEGGIFSQGRHTRARGYQGDCEKYNAAQMQGYRVLRLATGMAQLERVQEIVDWLSKTS